MEKSREILDAEEFVASFAIYEELRNKRILITGASGLIGRMLVRCLDKLDEKYDLGIVLFTPKHTEIESWMASNTEHVDYIIHLACPTASRDMVDHPVEVSDAIVSLTRQVLDYAKRQDAVMVYVSSMEVYGAVLTDEEIAEDYQGYVNPLSVRSSYPMGKRMSEMLCYCFAQEYGVDVRIARLVQTFGAGISSEDQRVFAQFARSIILGHDIILHTSGKSTRKYLYLTDAVSALLYIMLRGAKGEAYNAAHPDSYISIINLAKMLKQEFAPGIAVRVELQENAPYPEETHLNLATSKLESLGWMAQVPFREMLDRLIESLR